MTVRVKKLHQDSISQNVIAIINMLQNFINRFSQVKNAENLK